MGSFFSVISAAKRGSRCAAYPASSGPLLALGLRRVTLLVPVGCAEGFLQRALSAISDRGGPSTKFRLLTGHRPVLNQAIRQKKRDVAKARSSNPAVLLDAGPD